MTAGAKSMKCVHSEIEIGPIVLYILLITQ